MALILKERPIKNNQSYVKNAQIEDERYRRFQERGPLGAILHSIGTPQPLAEPIAAYFDDPSVEASVHMVLQPDGLCLQLAPENYRLWHVGGQANETHLGIEMTEPAAIRYDSSRGFTPIILDRQAALSHIRSCYDRGVELFAYLCQKYGWDPMKDGVILSHREAFTRGLGSNHGDPEHLWDALETGYTMDGFRKAVAQAMKSPLVEDGENEDQEGKEMRYETLGDVRKDPNGKYYLPTLEFLLQKGYLQGRGGKGDDLILDLSEDALRILVTLHRAGAYDK